MAAVRQAVPLGQVRTRPTVDPERVPPSGLGEVDETSLPLRPKDTPLVAESGRSDEGKLLLAGAVEIQDKGPGRARLQVIEDYSAATLGGFVAACTQLEGIKHDPKVVGPLAAHVVLPGIDPMFANIKHCGLGVYHSLRAPHLHRYLDEYVFRFNRRRTPQPAFSLLGLAARHDHATHHMLTRQS